MSGSPIKHERKRLARESLLSVAAMHAATTAAIVRGAKEGIDPAKLLEPQAKALWDKGLEGDVSAIREIFDRTDGKVAQEIAVDRTDTHLVDSALLGTMGELLKLAAMRRLELKATEKVVEKVVSESPDA